MSPFNPNNPLQQNQEQLKRFQEQQQEQQRRQQEMGAHYEWEKKRKKQQQIQDGIAYGRQQGGVDIRSGDGLNVGGDVVGRDKHENINVSVPGEEEVERSGCANAILKMGMFALVWVVCSVFAGIGLGAVGYGALQIIGAAIGADIRGEIGAGIGAVLGIAFAFAFALSSVSGKKKNRA